MENILTYRQEGDVLIPNLTLGEQPDRDLGKYGRMRRTYLKEYRPGMFNRLTLNGTLFSHLLEIEDPAKTAARTPDTARSRSFAPPRPPQYRKADCRPFRR